MIPPELRKHFSRDRDVMSGALVFAGTRVPVRNLFDFLAGGDDIERFYEGYPGVSPDQVRAALIASAELLESEYPEPKQASA